MPGPTRTANLLVLYGHGAVLDQTFNFQRPDASKINLYSWTREGIPVWDIQIQAAATQALANNTISASYATVNSSRIGGAQFKDYLIGAPTGLALPAIPAGYGTTAIAALGATVRHDAPTLGASTRLILMVDNGRPNIRLSALLNDANFNGRPFDVLWCACKS
ncbi:hypothetical protein GTP58_21960 [Duganella sp. CY15W]|uniref:putative adhesin n=1 Tax=Duganella sp. CY15W TaxID=2692172 RepID=UPI00136A5BD8|nr:hypothetical protein [Duganella sp. CY15W]MYM31008.1 hypothetical protein [Duganella sp. CY15W]